MTLPLSDLRIVEFGGQGPGPFAGGLLADFGADVVRIDRPGPPIIEPRYDAYNRNKRSVSLNLKVPQEWAVVKELIAKADVVIEGYRPGVMEKLGFGPDDCLAFNPRLVYGRMTGWGQDGPMAREAGHDINYLALTGALNSFGFPDRPPVAPLNLVADLGGGGMYLAFGIMTALHERRTSGKGQVVDCAMIEGVSHLMSMFHSFRQQGTWTDGRMDNSVDGGAADYGCFETKDGKHVSVGALEPQFYQSLVTVLGLDPEKIPDRRERANWSELRRLFAERFLTRTRAEWEEAMAGTDACFSPVLTMGEAWEHPQMKARGVFVEFDGLVHPAPTPRLSRTPGSLRRLTPTPGDHNAEVLADWGVRAG